MDMERYFERVEDASDGVEKRSRCITVTDGVWKASTAKRRHNTDSQEPYDAD